MTTALPQHATPGAELPARAAASDDLLTVGALGGLGFVLTDTLQQGLGHALPALLTISPFGMLTAAGWSSAYDSRAIDAGGCLVNFMVAVLAAAALVSWKHGASRARFFLLLICAFNLLAGSGYLVFAGLTDFGDWYSLVEGHAAPNLFRGVLLGSGALLWIAALFVAGSLLGRQFGILRTARRRAVRLMVCSWLVAVLVAVLAASVNRIGIRFVLLSDFPVTTLALSGLLFVPLCVHGRPARDAAPTGPMDRSWAWIAVSAAFILAFVVVLGRGLTLHGNVQ